MFLKGDEKNSVKIGDVQI